MVEGLDILADERRMVVLFIGKTAGLVDIVTACNPKPFEQEAMRYPPGTAEQIDHACVRLRSLLNPGRG